MSNHATRPITVLLADDHELFREGLLAMLRQYPDIQVVGEASNGLAAVEGARRLKPDVVVMDVTMPDLNGIEATREIVSLGLKTNILALTMRSEARFTTEMLQAGARGYLVKHCASEELVEAIRTVACNENYLSPRLAGEVAKAVFAHPHRPQSSVFTALTSREREVLQLLADGKSTKEVAAELYLSVKTVSTHREHIMEKLGLHSIAELTKYAIREGLTSVDE